DGGDGQHHPERIPQLHITYRVDSWTPIKRTETVTDEEEGVTFEASSDDAEQENDEIDSLFDDDLDAGWEGAPEDQNILTTGLRFRDIMIPDGAQITAAHLLLFSHEGKSAEDVARITIVGEAADNAETYTEDALITDRPQTTANVLWEVAEDWEIYLPYMTPDLSSIVQEIVDREGWVSGNALAFTLLGENQGPSDAENAREFESFENIADPEDGGDGQHHPERIPQLLITYQVASGTSTFASNVKELKVFPNPATLGEVRIELDSEKAAVIRVYNTQSQVLKTVRHQGGKQLLLNISDLPSGTYYIQAKQENEWYVQKLVVQP
ncbi:MAG: T9SS type A sorting domain-containing protein, partial [Saprospiraceae bacterium]|nr:T9SS type A sorting domain-containing protein [Saprospiraceae bacterium]